MALLEVVGGGSRGEREVVEGAYAGGALGPVGELHAVGVCH